MIQFLTGRNHIALSLAKVNPLLSATLLLLISFLLAVMTGQKVLESNIELSQSRLTDSSQQFKTLLKERLEIYERGLIGFRGAMHASGGNIYNRREFQGYVQELDMHRTFPGAHGFGFVRRVPKESEKNFISSFTQEWDTEYEINQISEHDDDKWIIERLEPLEGNEKAIGLDIASEYRRYEAIRTAIETNKPALTPPITLQQAKDKPNMGFLLVMPIRSSKKPFDIIGLTYLPLLIDEVLSGYVMSSGEFIVRLSDISRNKDAKYFYTNESADDKVADDLYQVMDVNVYGRQWRIELNATELFVKRLGLASPISSGVRVFTVGILATLLLYISLLYIRRQAYALNQRTHELDRARRDLQTVFDAVPSIIGYWDCDLRNRMANRSYLAWFGHDPEVMTGMQMHKVIGDELYKKNEHYIIGVLQGEAQSFESRFKDPNGRSIASSVNYIPDFVDGEQKGFYVIGHDITDFKDSQHRLEQVLRENEVLLSTLNQQLLYSVTDSKGVIIEVNDNFCGISGYLREELIGNTHKIINSGEHDRKFWQDVWRNIAQGHAWHGEVCNRSKSGDLYWVDTVIAPFIGTDGKVERYVSMRTDVTARHLLDINLRDAKLAAEDANQAKSEFLANMSHEIRTPMNGILGFGYLLERQTMSPAALSMVQKIQSASQSLLGIIDDILDFSKIEAGHLSLDESPFDLCEVIDQLASLMSGSVSDKSIDLIIDSPPNNTRYLIGDMVRLTQILRNLVSNALKFTYLGEVSVAIDVVSKSTVDNSVVLKFIIKDTGIGISSDKLENIFNSFSQGDTTITRRFGGTGLGLTISQSLAMLMGGNISVSSIEGGGSEFILTVPFLLDTESMFTKNKDLSLRALFGCDERSGENFTKMAASLGWQADVVTSAAAMLQAVQDNANYDIVLADWQLPDDNGLNALTKMLKLAKNVNPPVTLVTVKPQSTDTLHMHDASEKVDSIIIKPITCSALQNAVLNVLNYRAHPELGLTHLGEKLSGIRILLADDSQLNLEVAEHILRNESALVTTVNNGQMAVDLLEQRASDFDIVLMDIQMPVMDGFTATRIIREKLSIRELPIIALTAGALSTQKQLALDAGMNDFVTKPFVVDDLVAIVKRVAAKSLAVTSTQVLTGSAATVISAQELEAGDEWQEIMGRFRSRFFEERVPAFRDAYSALIDNSEGDWQDDLKFLIHKLAGEAGFVGFTEISELSKRIEQCWDLNGLNDEVRELLQELSFNLDNAAQLG